MRRYFFTVEHKVSIRLKLVLPYSTSLKILTDLNTIELLLTKIESTISINFAALDRLRSVFWLILVSELKRKVNFLGGSWICSFLLDQTDKSVTEAINFSFHCQCESVDLWFFSLWKHFYRFSCCTCWGRGGWLFFFFNAVLSSISDPWGFDTDPDQQISKDQYH